MENKELLIKIKDLGGWYQNINIDGIITTKGGSHSKKPKADLIWSYINSCINSDYKPLKILDLGCNAGYYSIMAAKEGATVVGVEAKTQYFNQALFLKEYYENLWKTTLNITCLHKDILDVDFDKIGKVNYIFALFILYHIGKNKFGKGSQKTHSVQKEILAKLSDLTDNFIIGTKSGEHCSHIYFGKILKDLGFEESKLIPMGRRMIALYKKI